MIKKKGGIELTVELSPVDPWRIHRWMEQKGSSWRPAREWENNGHWVAEAIEENNCDESDLKRITLLFAAACSATSRIDSGDTVRKKPAI